ncbi:MAG: restriction endonuclease subunit S, partial [archaeon]|nr:restriction endonuclease subunit S [archaeon]
MSLKRLNKIDFSGEIHLSDKKTNTDMILVKKGDLVISGINVEKGAVAVYQGKEDILATIHYSAYIFDETRIDIEYFKVFLKSKAFKEIINSQIRGGIKTEIKPKTFLKLEIHLPDLQTQIEIKTLLNTKMREIDNYSGIQENNLKLLTKLRQQILQDAVQSKLVKQDPKDEPASELLKKIKAEKEKLIKEGKIRKEKPLAPISEDEIPYELPKGWEWVRLGDICEILTQGPNPKYDGIENNNFRVLKTKDFYDNIIHYEKTDRISKDIFKEFERFKLITGDLVFGLVGVGSTSKCTIFTEQK